MRVWSFRYKNKDKDVIKVHYGNRNANFAYICTDNSEYLGLKFLCDDLEYIESVLGCGIEDVELYEYEIPSRRLRSIYCDAVVEDEMGMPHSDIKYFDPTKFNVAYASEYIYYNFVYVEFDESPKEFNIMKCNFKKNGSVVEILRTFGGQGASISVDKVKFDMYKKEGSKLCARFGMNGFLPSTTFEECMAQAQDSTRIILLHYWKNCYDKRKPLSDVFGNYFSDYLLNCGDEKINDACSEFRDKISNILQYHENNYYGYTASDIDGAYIQSSENYEYEDYMDVMNGGYDD